MSSIRHGKLLGCRCAGDVLKTSTERPSRRPKNVFWVLSLGCGQ